MNDHVFIICAYKESSFLEECILSLKEQTVTSRIIISTATPNEFIQGLAQKYNLPIFTHTGGGIGIDWNAGLDVVKEKYVTLIHQDDIYEKTYLEKCLTSLKQHEDSLIAFTNYQELKNTTSIPKNSNLKIKEILLKPMKWFPKSKFVRNRSLSLGNGICCPAVSYNMDNLKGFRFNETLKCDLDWEAWYRIAQMEGSFCYIPEDLMKHRIHDESETTNAIENNIRTKEDLMMFKKFWPNSIAKLLMKFYVKSQDTN